MLQLAVCDDDQSILDRVENIVSEYNLEREANERFEIKSYSSSTVLHDEVSDGEIFNTFILDIEMEMLDGFALAREIRKYMPLAAIIFLSSHTEYNFTQEGYKVRALRYVSKIYMETGLREALSAAIEASKITEVKYYTLTHYNDAIRVPLYEIAYVQRVARNTEIHTESHGKQSTRKPLKDVFKEINDKNFVLIDRSCFVNAGHVVKIENSSVILKDGTVLAVSRKMMPTVKSELLKLWGGLI